MVRYFTIAIEKLKMFNRLLRYMKGYGLRTGHFVQGIVKEVLWQYG